MLNWLVFCSFIFSFAMTLLGLIIDINYQVRFIPQIEKIQKEQSDGLSSYLQNKSYFSQHTFFKATVDKKRDFSIFLKQKLLNDDNNLISFETKKTVLALGSNWLEKRHLIEPNIKLDQLFSQIHHFDHWQLTNEDLAQYSILPTDFIICAQIYLANSIHLSPDDVILALEQTRHLSQLLLNTEILNFKLAGLSLLEKENQIIHYMNIRKYHGHESWKVIPMDEIKKFRNFLSQSDSYLSFLTKSKILDEVFLNEELPNGTCALYLNKNKMLLIAESFLKPHFIFEPNFNEVIMKMDQIKEKVKTNCQILIDNQPQNKTITQNVPYLRRVVGVRYLIQESKKL